MYSGCACAVGVAAIGIVDVHGSEEEKERALLLLASLLVLLKVLLNEDKHENREAT